jgi:hypothetical protein
MVRGLKSIKPGHCWTRTKNSRRSSPRIKELACRYARFRCRCKSENAVDAVDAMVADGSEGPFLAFDSSSSSFSQIQAPMHRCAGHRVMDHGPACPSCHPKPPDEANPSRPSPRLCPPTQHLHCPSPQTACLGLVSLAPVLISTTPSSFVCS